MEEKKSKRKPKTKKQRKPRTKKQRRPRSRRSRRSRRPRRSRRSRRSRRKTTTTTSTQAPPPGSENPFKLVMYHVVRIPWYIVKTFDWFFTLFTALLVYLSK